MVGILTDHAFSIFFPIWLVTKLLPNNIRISKILKRITNSKTGVFFTITPRYF